MKQFEFTTKGRVKIISSEEIQMREVAASNGQLSAPPPPNEDGYKAAVLECQKVLDELGIPTAKGQQCSEPGCNSQLGHRLRKLRDLYTDNKQILEEIEKVIQGGGDIFKINELVTRNKAH